MKSTDNLLKELAAAESIEDYIAQNTADFIDITLSEYLQALLDEKGMEKADVIRRAELNEIYGYQIFSGRKSPSRDKVISLAFGFGLDIQETQQLLKSCGLPFLYAKHKRDSIILFALHKGLSVVEANNLLYDSDEDTLSQS